MVKTAVEAVGINDSFPGSGAIRTALVRSFWHIPGTRLDGRLFQYSTEALNNDKVDLIGNRLVIKSVLIIRLPERMWMRAWKRQQPN